MHVYVSISENFSVHAVTLAGRTRNQKRNRRLSFFRRYRKSFLQSRIKYAPGNCLRRHRERRTSSSIGQVASNSRRGIDRKFHLGLVQSRRRGERSDLRLDFSTLTSALVFRSSSNLVSFEYRCRASICNSNARFL